MEEYDEEQSIHKMVSGSTASRDRLRSVLLTAVGVAPTFVGAPALGPVGRLAVETWWGPAVTRRLSIFVEMLISRILDVEDDVTEVRRRLAEGDVAAVGVIAASAATRAASDKKLEKIVDAMMNVIMNRDIWRGREEHAQTLMRLVDDFSATQLALLEFLAGSLRGPENCNFEGLPATGRVPMVDVLGRVFPHLAEDADIIPTAVEGLAARGLIHSPDGELYYLSIDSILSGRATFLGVQLAYFILDGAAKWRRD